MTRLQIPYTHIPYELEPLTPQDPVLPLTNSHNFPSNHDRTFIPRLSTPLSKKNVVFWTKKRTRSGLGFLKAFGAESGIDAVAAYVEAFGEVTDGGAAVAEAC